MAASVGQVTDVMEEGAQEIMEEGGQRVRTGIAKDLAQLDERESKWNRTCAFCPRTAESGEHIWSAWIGELFNSRAYNFSRFNIGTGGLKEWRRPKLDEKSKVVCSECNNGWMSDIEGRSKAAFSAMMRDGSAVSLLSRGLALLAAFAFKCAVIADHADSRGGPFFSAFERYRFRESLQVPRRVRMWIAAFHDPVGHRGVFTRYRSRPNQDGFRDLEFYVFTFLAGHLAFQVHATRWTALHKYGQALPRVELQSDWDAGTATEFWPNEHGFPVDWPPIYIGSDALHDFIYRWSGKVRIEILPDAAIR